MKKLITILLIFFSLLATAAPFNHIVMFGDSLSDNGNLYELMHHRFPVSPPYYAGRFSNGPIWIETLTNAYFPTDAAAHLLDYAFGGAAIATDDPDGDVLFTLQHEIDTYLLSHQNKAEADSLFVVWIGANNYLALPENEEEILAYVNQNICEQLQRLVQAGAKQILVLNLPDLGKTPIAHEFQLEQKLSYLATRHNQLLAQSVGQLKQQFPAVNWIFFDVHAAFDSVFSNPEKYGFYNIQDSCEQELVAKPSKTVIFQIANQAHILEQKIEPDHCKGYVFFDAVHPTVYTHQLIAQRIYSMLNKHYGD